MKEKIFHKVVPYKFTITAKTNAIAEDIINQIKQANVLLKNGNLKTIGFDFSPGHRDDKDYTYITAMCYSKYHSKEIMKIKSKYRDNEALFMYDDSLKLL